MPTPIAVSLHRWPWSMDVSEESVSAMDDRVKLEFHGSPVLSVMEGVQLLLPARHEKFIPLGPSSQNGVKVYEAPHGLLSQHGLGQGEMMVLFNDKRRNITIETTGAQGRMNEDGKAESPLASMILGWSQIFDDMLDDEFRTYSQKDNISWEIVLSLLKKQVKELQKPRTCPDRAYCRGLSYKPAWHCLGNASDSFERTQDAADKLYQ